MANKFRNSDQSFINAVKRSNTWANVARILNLEITGGASRSRFRQRANKLGVDTSHFLSSGWSKGTRGPLWKPVEHFLKKGKTCGIGSWRLRNRLYTEGLKSPKCENCNITEWEHNPISLHLHHKNGDDTDNRLCNLQILCPNCHSQTPNFCSRNRKSVLDKTLQTLCFSASSKS